MRLALTSYHARAAQRQNGWTLPEGYREIARGAISPRIQALIRSRCPSMVQGQPTGFPPCRLGELSDAEFRDSAGGSGPRRRSGFQPFVAGRLADGRRAFDTRVEILLTPTHMLFVTGFLRISAHVVPSHLDEGLVTDSTVFAANHSRGGALVGLGEWEEEVRAAALAVGEAFRQILNRTFETGVPGSSWGPA